uniref:HCLS1-binding protein 3 n=1 Tax=Bos taurus TaxID=9913 RepID=Q2KJG6_BOVIN|nr:HCLS1 binding protein 3 [Bos taurus]
MQSPAVLVTSRRVQNVHTGLDLSVPQHQEVRGKMMSGHVEYQILVVTRLAAFKSAKHRPEDVVQFLVSKKYSDIEEFYQKLCSRYPTASLPPLPRKVLFVGEGDIRERRALFDEILRCISKDAELAGSPELLEFLGTRSPGATDLSGRDVSVLDTDSQAGCLPSRVPKLKGDVRPGPALTPGCGWPDKALRLLPLPFLGQAWPDHGLLGPLAIGPVSTIEASSRVGPMSSGSTCSPVAPPFHGRPGLAALGLLLKAPSVCRWICLSGLPPSLEPGLAGLPSARGSPLPRSRSHGPCRTSQCLRLLPEAHAPA